MRPAKAQASLRIRAVSPEPSLFAHMKYGSIRCVRPNIRHLASLDGCACVFAEWIHGGQKVPKSHELANLISCWSLYHGEEAEEEEEESHMVWPHLKSVWHEEEESRKQEEEERGRDGKQHQRTDRTGVRRFPECSGRPGKMERYCWFRDCDDRPR